MIIVRKKAVARRRNSAEATFRNTFLSCDYAGARPFVAIRFGEFCSRWFGLRGRPLSSGQALAFGSASGIR